MDAKQLHLAKMRIADWLLPFPFLPRSCAVRFKFFGARPETLHLINVINGEGYKLETLFLGRDQQHQQH